MPKTGNNTIAVGSNKNEPTAIVFGFIDIPLFHHLLPVYYIDAPLGGLHYAAAAKVVGGCDGARGGCGGEGGDAALRRGYGNGSGGQ